MICGTDVYFHCTGKVMERPLLRDIVFYLAAGFWAFFVYWKQEIRLYDSLGFLGLYVAYIFVVLVGRYINNRTRNGSLYKNGTLKIAFRIKVENEYEHMMNIYHANS